MEFVLLKKSDDQIELREAVIFVANGYLTIESIVKEDSSVLLGLLVNRMPWSTAYCHDDQSNEDEDQYAFIGYYDDQLYQIHPIYRQTKENLFQVNVYDYLYNYSSSCLFFEYIEVKSFRFPREFIYQLI